MPVNTLSAAVHITPTVIKTFIKHSQRKGHKYRHADEEDLSTDDLIFDQAFHIVQAFILLGTKNTVESLQAFTNTHVPAPYWAAVSPVRIPLVTANRAADVLIDWFGPDDLKNVVGGERWWQVRGLDGIDGEWITEREYLSKDMVDVPAGQKMSEPDKDILRMECLDTVMLYIHGGGYFWGSINTHRYQIIRYARKIKGRAFAVNYRKAPQYPWPCPLQDVLAAYLYLINPPPEALHKAIPPSKIVFAGDSAGGGLSITVLTILRDMGLPLPAGAVLISPWVDLTHSFPSIMTNTATDIIPPHGFLSKPSTLWPVKPIDDEGRVRPASIGPPPKPGHADTLRPSSERREEEKNSSKVFEEDVQNKITRQKEMQSDAERLESHDSNGKANADGNGIPDASDIDFWQPKPPKVLMDDPHAVPLEMRSQIHMYAATEQLSHPLVSPILQGSLGNLCPLYILAGDGEVLRDEILHLAHRAAHPDRFPTRDGVLRDAHRQKENAEKFTTPTKVHLQAYDGMCHVLTVFLFTKSANYAYRSIAEFVKHVTSHSQEHLDRNPFPELHRPPSEVSTGSEPEHDPKSNNMFGSKQSPREDLNHSASEKSDVKLYKANKDQVPGEVKAGEVHKMPEAGSIHVDDETNRDIPDVLMLRERVDVHGVVRPMEPMEEIAALKVRPQEIGIIKEGPLNKWWSGQKEWDRKYRRSAERAIKKRKKMENEAKRVLDNARDQGLLMVHEELEAQARETLAPPTPARNVSNMSTLSRKSVGRIQNDRRWGPLDLGSENVPASAIAGRRDTAEAVALLKKSIYYSAPVTHSTVPTMKASDMIRAAFDPDDDPRTHPKQSVSEQQVRGSIIPGMHGLKMWDSIIRIFIRESSKKARKGKKGLHKTKEKITVSTRSSSNRLEQTTKSPNGHGEPSKSTNGPEQTPNTTNNGQ